MDWWEYLAIAAATAVVVATLAANMSAQRVRGAARLAAVERKLDLIMDHLGIAESEPYLPDVIAHLERGKKIHAIKAYRDATGVGLAEAKDAVEGIARDRGLEIR